MLTYHTAIIGAGASGLFCAGSFNAPKIILDHNKLPGVKVSVSGGGKCNFTNRSISANDYISLRKHFCKNALAAFKPTDFIQLLDENKIEYEERTHGQLFAKNARDIVHFLVKRAQMANTDFALATQVLDVKKTEGGFLVRTSAGMLQAQHIVLATGGLSYPDLGASSFGMQIAQKFGLCIAEQRPALCGLTFPKELRALWKILAGNSITATVRIGKYSFTDQVLFTHEGISGPAVLSASLYWSEGSSVEINFLPNINVEKTLEQYKQKNKKVSSVIRLPGHIAQVILGTLDQPLSNMKKSNFQAVIKRLSAFEFIPAGTSGYTKAEVTTGGIDVQEVNPTTFEVKKVPGLYVIGELLDVTGRLGGFNLHWAWASGYSAAKALEKILTQNNMLLI